MGGAQYYGAEKKAPSLPPAQGFLLLSIFRLLIILSPSHWPAPECWA